MGDNQTARKIIQGFSPVKLTLAGQVYAGDPVGYSSGWKQADANAAIYGEFVAGQNGSSGQTITVYRAALVGGFTGLTAGATMYLSDSAGQYGTSAGTVSQKIGVAVTATEVWAEPKAEVLAKAEAIPAAALALPRVEVLTSQTLLFSAFTDNTDATGYIDIATQLPAGAIPIAWKAVVATGFTGDTTAVIKVGVEGVLDRFSADTAQSVAAAATVGSACLAAGACDGIGAASTVRVTVTGGADFSSISAGSMVVYVYYIRT